MSVEEELNALHRYELQDRYLNLTRVELPAEARKQGWTLVEDHCFMQVILDRLFGDSWCNHLDRRLTAYKQLNEEQLRECITMAERLLAGDFETLMASNRDSLRWRGKLK